MKRNQLDYAQISSNVSQLFEKRVWKMKLFVAEIPLFLILEYVSKRFSPYQAEID